MHLTKRCITMTNVLFLQNELGKFIECNKSRLYFITKFIVALFTTRSVNFKKIANQILGAEQEDSRYRQIQRFFQIYEFDYDQIAFLVASIVPNKNQKWMLSIDRTNWKYGKQNINILTLAITYQGIAFPLMWTFLDKKGNSNTLERIQLIDKFLELFGKEKIECILADREFIGEEWFNYLNNIARVNFRIRIKNSEYINKKNGKKAFVKNFFRNIKIQEKKTLSDKRLLWNHRLYIVGTKSTSGEYVIIATNVKPDTALEDYSKRWEIETLFKCLKSSGFNFEDTHLKCPNKISKLMALLTIAYCWAYITGDWVTKDSPIKIKSHGRKEKSVFRVGLDTIGEIVIHIHRKIKQFKRVVRLLSCT